MQNELSTDFEEVTVEWVQQCPNLTQKPFYLTSPGKKSTVRLYFTVYCVKNAMYIYRTMRRYSYFGYRWNLKPFSIPEKKQDISL